MPTSALYQALTVVGGPLSVIFGVTGYYLFKEPDCGQPMSGSIQTNFDFLAGLLASKQLGSG
jgi:hypothetical protein